MQKYTSQERKSIKWYLEGGYEGVVVHNNGDVTGYQSGAPRRYSSRLNVGGRVLIGRVPEMLAIIATIEEA